MRSGFMLLEVLIALAISSMLSVILFFSVDQIAQSGQIMDNVIEIHKRAELVMRLFEHDISGAMLVDSSIKKVFFATQKDNNLELLTFITNNPLFMQENPVKMARVVYRLVPAKNINKKEKQSYVLTRQEIADISFDPVDKDATQEKSDAAKTARAYEVVDGIVSCELLFKPRKQDDEQKEKEKTASKKLKEQATWDSDSKFDGKDRTENQLIPQDVTCKVQYEDANKTKHLYTLHVPILVDMSGENAAATPPVPSNNTQGS